MSLVNISDKGFLIYIIKEIRDMMGCIVRHLVGLVNVSDKSFIIYIREIIHSCTTPTVPSSPLTSVRR